MLKEKIIFYSDCSIFGGCERPIFELMGSQVFRDKYDYLLIYRGSPGYKEGIKRYYPSFPLDKSKSVYFFDINTWYLHAEKKVGNVYLCRLLKIFLSITFRFLFIFVFFYELFFLFFLFLKEKASAIHINNGGYPGALSCQIAVIAARLAAKKRIVLNVHNTAHRKLGILSFIFDYFVRNSVSLVVTGAKSSGRALVANRGFEQKKIVNICHGVRPALQDKVRKPDSPVENGQYFIMVARYEKRKGHRYAILALKSLISEHPECKNTKLYLIGDGPLLNDTRGLVIRNNLQSNVVFLGHRDDYINYVASSLSLLSPSIGSEDLPYIVIEAMSLGIPVVGTDIAGIPEEVEDRVTGIIVPPFDIDALARGMFELLSDPALRIKMGVEARRSFNNSFTLDNMVSKYLGMYESLVRKDE